MKFSLGPITINTQLLASLIIFISSMYYVIERRVAIQSAHRAVFFCFFVYVLLSTFSILYSDHHVNVELFGLWVTLVATFTLLLIFKCKDSLSLKKIANLIIVFAVVQAVLAILQFVFNHPIVPKDHAQEWGGRVINRVSGTYRDPFDFGFYLSVSTLLLLFGFFNSVMISKYRYHLAVVFIAVIFLSQSLTNILGLVVSLILFFIFSNAKDKLILAKKTIYSLLLVFVFLIPLSFVFSNKIGLVISIVESRLEQYSSAGDESRSLHLKVGYDMMQDSNYLGFGYGSYDLTSPMYVTDETFVGAKYINFFRDSIKPKMISHSLPGAIMGELGVLGLIIFFWFLISLIKPFWSWGRNNKYRLLYGCFCCLIISRFMFYGFRLSDIFLFFLIFYFSSILALREINEEI